MRCRHVASRLAVVVACVALASGCGPGGGTPARAPRASPIVVIGADGLDWDLVLPLAHEGRLPNLSRLMERGQWGLLETFVPTESPVVWTTIATGREPRAHGILGFEKHGRHERRLFNNADRRVPALWNLASSHDLRVGVVGWWMTYPVEPVAGVMVAQTNTVSQLEVDHGRNVWKGRLVDGLPGQVWPPERQEAVTEALRDVDARLPELARQAFGEFPHPLSTLGQRLWRNCQWSFRADATYLRVALDLLRSEPFDLFLVYFGSPDVVGHRFWRYMRPDLYADRPAPEQVENLGGIIPDVYAWIDAALGRIAEAAGEDATLVVLSDHGMRPVRLEAGFDPEDVPANVNSAHHRGAPPGVWIAAGPWIRASGRVPAHSQELVRVGSVYDVAPTLLAWLRLPLARDMGGRVMSDLTLEAFAIGEQPEPVETHVTPTFLGSRPSALPLLEDEAERMRQLRELGYIP